jgi:3-phenylpropionate/cinnamic acid dioxygenase small subunit
MATHRLPDTPLPFDAALTAEVSHFLAREAHLLDTHRLDEWLSLYTGDATYWVPLAQNQPDPYEHSSIIHDDRTLLATRVAQYRHPRAHARLPATRTCHQVGNVLVLENTPPRIRVASTLVLIEYRQERQRQWGALVEHTLRRSAGSFAIAAKRIDLVNSEAELDGISLLF